MARPDDRRDARSSKGKKGSKRTPNFSKQSQHPKRMQTSGRDRAMEGGFGPYGAPRPPVRERRPDAEVPQRVAKPSRLRMRGERQAAGTAAKSARTRRTAAPHHRRRHRATSDVEAEILRLGGNRGPRLLTQLMAGADEFANGRDREALTLIRRVRDALPDSPTARELGGLAQYRLGNYRAAAKELEEYVRLTDAVEQHPVLMDCYRAQKRWAKVDELWADLSATSPSAELVTEGRIVAAGAKADHGQLHEAIGLLTRKARDVKSPREYHLRLWYALADLEERAGNLARARELFARIRKHEPDFADVGTRIATLT